LWAGLNGHFFYSNFMGGEMNLSRHVRKSILVVTLFLATACTKAAHMGRPVTFSPLNDSPSGSALYKTHCAGCHGPLENSAKINRTSSQIIAALASYPIMQPLQSRLSESEIDAIARALVKEVSPTPTLPPQPAGPCLEVLPERRVWTLSRREYDNTVKAVLGENSNPARKAFPGEWTANGYSSNANSQIVTSALVPILMSTAESVAATSINREQNYISTTLACTLSTTPSATTKDPCAVKYIQSRGAALFRRPLTTTDIDDLYNAYYVGFTNPDSGVTGRASGIQTVIATVLQMPEFFYRTELGAPGDTASPIQLTPYEIASSLSYLATGGPPDSTLTNEAAANRLNTPELIAAQFQRLASSTQGREWMGQFIMEWLGEFDIANKGGAAPFTPLIAATMEAETKKFAEEAIFNRSSTVQELLTGQYTFVNAELAAFYGLPTTGLTTDLVKVSLATSGRAGLLSQGSFLVANSQKGIPLLHRGAVVRNRVLCEVLPSMDDVGLPGFTPPPFQKPPTGTTTKKALSDLIGNAGACYSCHQYFQPIGYALENLDPWGRWRLTENGGTVDSSGFLANSSTIDPNTGKIRAPASASITPFTDYRDMVATLANHPRVNSCFATQITTYMSGRSDLSQNECTIQDVLKSPATGSPVTVLQQFTNFVQSKAFAWRKR